MSLFGRRHFFQQTDLQSFDYASYAFGIVATLVVIRFWNGTGPLLFFMDVFATAICLWCLITLVGNFFTHHLTRSKEKICFYHVVCNFIPKFHVLSRLKETPWGHFAG